MLAITLSPLSIPSLDVLLELSAVFIIATHCLAPTYSGLLEFWYVEKNK
jgi:hypothetical protein